MNPDKYLSYQLWIALAAVMLSKVFHTSPRGVALAASTAAPWMVLVSAAITFVLFWPVARVLSQRPGGTLVSLSLEAGGRGLAIGVALALCAFVVATGGISLRQVSEMAVTAIYPHTPQTWIMVSLLIAAAMGAALTPAGLIWIGTLFAGPALLAIMLVMLGNLGWSDYHNILPASGPGLLPLAGQALPLTSYYGELVFLTAFCAYLETPRRLVQAAAWALGSAAAVWALVLLLFLMVFTLPDGLAVPFPFFELTQLVMGGRFMERIDALWILLWTFGSAGLLAAGIMFGSLLFREAFRLPDHRGAVLPLASAVLATALFPSNQAGAIDAETFFLRRWGFLVTFGVPLGVALLAQLRERGAHG